MQKKSIVSIIILAVIGLIFTSDAVLLSIGFPTYSQNITEWIGAEPENMVAFIGGVVLLSIHWVFAKYTKK